MKLKQMTTVGLGGLTAALAMGFAACSPKAQTSDTAQSMPGMNHGAGAMNAGAMNAGAMNMNLGPKDESFDLRFIDGMTPHHQGGVEMAQEALQKSQRPEIKQLATAIIAAQEKEITQLQDWRKTWYPNVSETAMMYDTSMGHMMPMSTEMRDSMMMSSDLGAADDQFDLRFLNAMIPHHEGALDMANQVLENSDRPEIRQMAQEILTTQQAEIDQMQQWRKDWYGQ